MITDRLQRHRPLLPITDKTLAVSVMTPGESSTKTMELNISSSKSVGHYDTQTVTQ